LIAEAAQAGASAAALYVGVVRPALVDLQRADRHVRARLAAGIGEAILADLVTAFAQTPRSSGVGRAAVLSCRDQGIEAVDGSVAMDFLEAEGWNVDQVTAGTSLPDAAGVAGAGIELVVAVTAGPQDALALAQVCTELHRLPDPPVIVLCDFSGRPAPRAASTALGADAVALDPEDLVRCAARELPATGHRRWGVRLSRLGTTLSLAPTGCLNATSVGRLADVALSRTGTFDRLIVDLRDLAEVDVTGVHHLAAWPDAPGLGDIEFVVVASAELRRSLHELSPQLPLRVVGTSDEALVAVA
jgi:anti-anti-sigma regulatory factor